jgi:adenosylhomocysteine nucleosidase
MQTAAPALSVVAALPEELRPLQRRLQKPRIQRLAAGKLTAGRLGPCEVLLMATGDGERRAGRGLAAVLSTFDVGAVIVIGIAGALSPDLEVGRLVVATRVLNDAGPVDSPDPGWLIRARRQAEITAGTVFSSSQIAIDPVAKHRLWLQAEQRPAVVVDLESATYGRAAAAHGVPWMVIRAVSDAADEALPLDFNRYRRQDGSVDRARVLRHGLLHPSILPELMQLKERVHDCAARLADFVERMLSP